MDTLCTFLWRENLSSITLVLYLYKQINTCTTASEQINASYLTNSFSKHFLKKLVIFLMTNILKKTNNLIFILRTYSRVILAWDLQSFSLIEPNDNKLLKNTKPRKVNIYIVFLYIGNINFIKANYNKTSGT